MAGTGWCKNAEDYLSGEEARRMQDPATFAALAASKKVRHAEYYRVYFMLLFETGCRIGEMAGITWSSVRSSNEPGDSFVVINSSRDGLRIGGPKTRAGNRKIFISDELAAALIGHREHQYDYSRTRAPSTGQDDTRSVPDSNPLDLVCTSPSGKPLDVRGFRKRIFPALCTQAGIDANRPSGRMPHPHTVRHTFFTHSGEAGVNLFTLMAVGGQKDVRATAVYMGITDDEGKAARDRYLGRIKGSK